MSPIQRTASGRSIVEDVFGRDMTHEIWTGNYTKAIPMSIQDFDLSAILPAVFYMFRFGYRRGKGKFLEKFGGDIGASIRERRRAATIDRVAGQLARSPSLLGFEGEVEESILGDLLLCFCLENTKRALGRNEHLQRVAPAHYMSSWVDLPTSVAHLRFVPEMIVAMLASQEGDFIQQNKEGERTWFAVGKGFEDNVLLRAFHQGIMWRGEPGELANLSSDRFDEETPVGVDQLLMIRLAQMLDAAPDKLRGGGVGRERISNQRPIAEKAARHFSEDIRRFVRCYADVIPRHAFVSMIESCMAVGLMMILGSMFEILFEWAETGQIPNKREQKSVSLFTDCSNGVDRRLRALAEQSFDDYVRRIERFPVIFMALRLLDLGARHDRRIKQLNVPTTPCATEWINLLGELLYRRRDEADAILYDLDRKAEELAEKLREDSPEVAEILVNADTYPNPVWRLAEALTSMQGRNNTQQNLIKCLDSSLMLGSPNGLAVKRRTVRNQGMTGHKTNRDIRSLVLTDSVLDYLVHLHVLPGGNRHGERLLSFKEFVRTLHERYGFCVDVAPPGMTISNVLLQTNRAVLEHRLRDLGLLSGVNDAEAMKRLRPRFRPAGENDNGIE